MVDGLLRWIQVWTLDDAHFAAEEPRGTKVTCIEEIAYRIGYIDVKQVRKQAESLSKNGYGPYPLQIIEEKT